MLCIPIELPPEARRGPVLFILVLERENMDRMRLGDPFDLHFSAYDAHMPTDRPIRDLDIVVAYEEDAAKIVGFRERNDIKGLIKYLERGRVHRPGELTPPTKLRRQ